MSALNLWGHNVEFSRLWDAASVLTACTSTQLFSHWKENTTAGDNSAVCVMALQSLGTRLLSAGTSRDLDAAHHKWGHSPTSQRRSMPKPNSQTLKPLLTCIRLHDLLPQSPRLLSITTPNRSEPNFLYSQWGLGFLHFWQLEHCRLFFKTKKADSLSTMGLKWGTADVAQ